MKDQIPEFLQQKLNQHHANTENFPEDIKKFLLDWDIYYNWNFKNILKIFKIMKMNVSDIPTCSLDGCDKNVNLHTFLVLW